MHGLEKAPTGIEGFGEITYGGLPRGGTTLVIGARTNEAGRGDLLRRRGADEPVVGAERP